MGKSLDLPDPLESTPNKPLANADDLLAQLAGEEVDRLLAESDAEGKQKSAPPPPEAGAPAPIAPEAPIQDQLDALFSEISTAQPNPSPTSPAAPEAKSKNPAPAPAPVAPISAGPIGPVASNLPTDVNPDEVLAAILGEPGKMGKLPDFAAPVAPPAALLAAHAAHAALVAPAETSAAERAALVKAESADELPGPGELDALTGPIEEEGPLPAYLKPLEWLNAPLDLLPSAARDVLGQVAILTLVNAIAVLIYVFVFRKH